MTDTDATVVPIPRAVPEPEQAAVVAGMVEDVTDPEARLVMAMAPDDVHDYDEGDAEQVLDSWYVEDLAGAAWAARKRTILLERIARIRAVRDDQIARVDAWYARETERMGRDLRFFEGRLEGFHRAELERDPRHSKSITLPDGTILRSQAGKISVEVQDLDALQRWAEENERPELLRDADPAPEKAAIAKAFGGKAAADMNAGEYPAVDNDGVILPGVVLVRGPRTFTQSSPDRDGDQREDADHDDPTTDDRSDDQREPPPPVDGPDRPDAAG